ncbi:MAG TPA: hypothetical protein VJT78_14210 [Candidatus Dormibacteraeota bacterium]|nr:hypothetical protein [Candidatus Dormibacteraeota bacterium]
MWSDMRSALVLLVLVAACGSAAPVPAPGSPLTVPQLEFAVIDAVGKPVYCDPDFYPVAREGGEQASAITRYPEIQADSATYATIVAHEHLPSSDLTDAEKLTVYRAWKLLRALVLTETNSGARYAFEYRVAASAAYWMVKGTVDIAGAVKVASRSASGPPPCPICLADSTLIATPDGPVRVTAIRVGMVVWTQDISGRQVAAPVVEVGSMAVPSGHLMVHLVLADGRSLLVSPGHPTADGRTAGALRAGDALDGSRIKLWELVPYGAGRTYDLLPAGATGHYWANGILIGSTLA